MRPCQFFAVVLAGANLIAVAGAREWTDVSGLHHVEARLLQCRDNTVWLEKPNAKLVLVPIEKLSLADRAYVARELPGQVSTIEASPATTAVARRAKNALPALPPEALARQRELAAFRFASLSRKLNQPPEVEEIEIPIDAPELPAAEEMPAEEELVEPAAEEPAAEEPLTDEPVTDEPLGLPEADEPAVEPLEEPAGEPGDSPSDEAAVEEPSMEEPVEAEDDAAAERESESTATEEIPQPAPKTPPAKYIYSGRCGTFHLIDEIGTGAYWYQGKHYLAMLFKAGEDDNYLYYDSNHPDGQIIQWYFSKTERCCKYWVWKRTGTGHGHYEREHRERPN